MLEQVFGHENGVTSIDFAHGDLYSGSFDHYIICWDLNEIDDRIEERAEHKRVDIESRQQEVYWRAMENKKGKRKGRGKAQAKAGGARKAGASKKPKKK